LKYRFLAVLLLTISVQATSVAQQIFRVSWDSGKGRAMEDYTELERAKEVADSIAHLMYSEGYLEGYFHTESHPDTVVYSWNSGELFRWGSVNMRDTPRAFIDQLGHPGARYPEPYRWIEEALLLAENSGHPFASLKIDSLTVKDRLIFGVMSYDPGPLITWDSLALLGDTKTKATYVQKISGLRPGEPFSQFRLEKATQTLRRSPYFTLVGAPQLSFQTRQATPIFTLQDRRVNVFDGVVGFMPNENEAGKLLVTGEVDLRLYHLGGKGRDLSIQWQRLNIQSQSLELHAKEAFLLRTPLDVQMGFSLLKQDSTFVNRTLELDFGYRISDEGDLTFFTKRKAGDLISSGFESSTLPEAIDYRWNQYGMGVDWDKLDSPVSPRRGARVQGQLSMGNKRILQNTGLPQDLYAGLEESSAQYQGWVSLEKHLYIRPAWGVWIRGVGGLLQNKNLFLNELYRIGGLKTIRGFNEKNFYADRYGFLNLEQRLFFDQNSFLMVFADAGILKNPFETEKIDRPISFGTGINLDTDGGLFSFVFALGKSTTQPLSFSYSRIHFGYLARF
jgi:outer membrane protein assembly factor BamA